MLKKNKWNIIISIIITLLPVAVGLLLWDKLPDQIATHFDMNNQPNGWSGKEFTVFGIPAILLICQLLCLCGTMLDPKNKNISVKAFGVVIWIIPVCSIMVMFSCYGYALGYVINIGTIAGVFLGIIFIALGNYLPKNKTNYTFGFRCPWTLNDEENWNYTNRIAGYCFVIGGILIIAAALLKKSILMIPIIILMVLIPYVVSFIYFKNHD
ncbi:MAG: SdpI family protein [Lachnospiraceae bacterium]|nr:SdpI family protein [Lachnospiraceae bacterium]